MSHGKRLYLLSPVARGKKGEFKKEVALLQKKGFQRLKVDGEMYDIEDFPDLSKTVKHDISVVVDRVVVKDGIASRLADSIETALNLSNGLLLVEDADAKEEYIFSSKFACPVSGFTIEEIEPRLFSFNNPYGACPECGGLGFKLYVDPELVVPDTSLSLAQEAFAPAFLSATKFYYEMLESIANHFKVSMNTPFKDLPKEMKDVLFYGSGEKDIPITFYKGTDKEHTIKKPFEGVINNMERRFLETESDWAREEISRYQSTSPCEKCKGARLNEKALAVKIKGLNISEATKMSVTEALAWFSSLPSDLKTQDKEIAVRILKEINDRLSFLANVGLGYLTLSRASATLSGGESQRIRLSSQIGSGLTGVLYVLDEPSIGLHQRDNGKLLESLKKLVELDNTVVVIEHDDETIKAADYVIDMGKGAGTMGGEVIAQGTPAEIMENPESITGAYLSGRKQVPLPKVRRKGNGKFIKLYGAKENNLKNVNVSFPLGTLSLVTGVSGSGKSSLITQTLFPAINKILNKSKNVCGAYDKITGIGEIDKIIDINQAPIGRTPRSNPATYTGLFSHIRDWFAELPEAKERGYKSGRFSFNVKGGRCEACEGEGVKHIQMHFMADLYVTCDECKGKRYNRETLEILYKGKSIADVLDMTVDDAYEFFSAFPSMKRKLDVLRQVGLGYIKLGQSSTTLSGGEAQRIKLAKELSRQATGKTLYVLDEPTTGLHFADIEKLMEALQRLVDNGNTVIIIEHNLDVIKQADYIIDLGKEGGESGGMIIASGTPEEIAANPESYTGQYLRPYLKEV